MKLLVADHSLFYQIVPQGLAESWGYEVVPRLAIPACLIPGRSGLELREPIRARQQAYLYAFLLPAADRQSEVLGDLTLDRAMILASYSIHTDAEHGLRLVN